MPERKTPPVASCEICGRDLYDEDDEHFWPDDFVRTEDGAICWDCWLEYGRRKMKEQRK